MIRNQIDRERGLPVLTVLTGLWCVGVFLMLNFQKDQSYAAAAKWGLYSDDGIYGGAWWGLITSAFVHIEIVHLIFNLYWLWILGGAFERAVGPARWMALVLAAAFVSSGLQLLSGGAGIGLSGVVYAIFGFAWMTRRRYPEFTVIANDKTVQIFIGWGVICIIATYAKVMNIGNVAHFGGLAFGMAIGAWQTVSEKRVWFGLALGVLVAGATTSLFWGPISEAWVSKKASDAHDAGRLSEAAAYYERSLELGAGPISAWGNLARIYGYQKDEVRYKRALERLESFDIDDYEEVKRLYGDPNKPPSP